MRDRQFTLRFNLRQLVIGVAALALVGGGILIGVLVGSSGGRSSKVVVATSIPAPSSTVPPTTTATTQPLPATTAQPTIRPTTVTTIPIPRGSVTYTMGGEFGQTFSSGGCEDWHEEILNNSNTEVVSLTLPLTDSKIDNRRFDSQREERAGPIPSPLSFSVSIPAYSKQVVDLRPCIPADLVPAGWEVNSTAPLEFRWQWVTGQTGRSCFNLGC